MKKHSHLSKGILTVIFLLFTSTFFSQRDMFTAETSYDIINKGVKFHDEKEYDKAIEQFKMVNRNDSGYYIAAIELLNTYLAAKKSDEGLAYCNRLLTIKNDYTPNFLVFKGDFLDELKRTKEAEDIFLYGQKEYPTNNSFYYELGVVKMRQAKYEDAFNCFVQSIRINPFHSASHYQLGLMAHRHNNITGTMLSTMFYFLCDNSSKRAKRMVGDLEKISKQEIEPDTLFSTKIFTDQNTFEEIESIIRSKAALGAKYKAKTDLKYDLVKQEQLVIENIGKYKDVKGFYNEVYGKFFDELNKAGYLEQYLYFSLSGLELEEVNKWRDKNRSKMTEFETWAYNYFCEKLATYEENLNGVKTKVPHYSAKNRVASAGIKNSKGDNEGYWNFYFTNGIKKSEGAFKNGSKDGLWRYYHKTGDIKEESMFKDGKEVSYKSYFKNGNPKIEFPMAGDQIDGEMRSYFANGNVKLTRVYKQGKINGTEVHYYRNGQKEISYNNINEVYDGAIEEFYDNGKPYTKFTIVKNERQGDYKEFHNDDKSTLKMEGKYLDGKRSGEWKVYHPNAKLLSVGSYNKDGKRDGTYKSYFRSGTLSSEETYEDGKLSGAQKYYDYDGKLWEEYVYKKGKLKEYKAFKKDASPICDTKINGKNFKITQYHPLGKKRREGASTDGDLDGVWKYYTNFGVLTTEINYKEGRYEGKYTTYHPNGQISTETPYVNDVQDGYYTSYFINGKLKTEGMLKDDKKVGIWKYYNIHGTIDRVYYNIDDESEGWSEFYDVKGRLDREELVSEGVLIRMVYYDTLGNVRQNIDLSKGTGVLEKKNMAGKLMLKKAFVKDLAEGPSIDYYADGTIESQVTFKNGNREGKFIAYDELGRKTREMNFFNNDITGKKILYFEDGKMDSYFTYLKDEYNGKSEVFHENGKLYKESNYEDDEIQGESTMFDEFGELIYKRTYHNDLLVSYTYKDASGNFLPEKSLADGDNKLVAYFPNGKKSVEVGYTNGDLNGKRVIYYSNGKVSIEDEFYYNSANGSTKEYYSNGNLKAKENHYYGEIDGKCEYFYPDGKIKKMVTYYMGSRHGWTIYYDASGKVIKSIWYYNDDSIFVK